VDRKKTSGNPDFVFRLPDPPKVQLSIGKNIDPMTIAEGNDVYLDCAIKANPRAYKVEWLHNVSIFKIKVLEVCIDLNRSWWHFQS
jgi:hypothetical protein